MVEDSTRVRLATDVVRFVVDEAQRELPCEIVIETTPEPRLFILVTGLEPVIVLRQQQVFELHLVRARTTCDAFLGSTSDGAIAFKPRTEPVTVGQSLSLANVAFDLVNFPHFWGLDSPTTKLPDDHLDIRAGDWQLQVRPPRQDAGTAAFRSPLYSVTHSCTLRRDSPFASDDAQAVLAVLHDALSFAAGQWVGLAFVRGFDYGKTLVWEKWGTGPVHPCLRQVHTWFDRHHGHALGALLSGMLAVQMDQTRARSMHAAIYWYIRASGVAQGVDGGTILLQAALELLAHQYFILEGRAPANKQFAREGASERIRMLLFTCGIPTKIPEELGDLLNAAVRYDWRDGPEAIARVRNQLVHPRGEAGLPYHDVWRLAEWYVELVLLRMASFEGEYSNRIKRRWVGEVEPVPWA